MSTYMPKAGDITRTWYILDAEGQSLGISRSVKELGGDLV